MVAVGSINEAEKLYWGAETSSEDDLLIMCSIAKSWLSKLLLAFAYLTNYTKQPLNVKLFEMQFTHNRMIVCL